MNGHEIKEETNERQTRARSIVFVAPTNVLRREGTRRFCGWFYGCPWKLYELTPDPKTHRITPWPRFVRSCPTSFPTSRLPTFLRVLSVKRSRERRRKLRAAIDPPGSFGRLPTKRARVQMYQRHDATGILTIFIRSDVLPTSLWLLTLNSIRFSFTFFHRVGIALWIDDHFTFGIRICKLWICQYIRKHIFFNSFVDSFRFFFLTMLVETFSFINRWPFYGDLS